MDKPPHKALGSFAFWSIAAILVFAGASRWLSELGWQIPLIGSKVQSVLRLNSDNTFQLTIFTDLHFGDHEDSEGPGDDAKTYHLMRSMLKIEQPNLVVLNGDLVHGDHTFLHNSTKYVDMIVKPMTETSTPWASAYGNHDQAFNLSSKALYREEKKHYPLTYTRHSPPGVDGVTNYWIPIFPYKSSNKGQSDDESPAAILWFFDSLGGYKFQDSSDSKALPDYVTSTVVSWFKNQQAMIRRMWPTTIPSLAFVHIPPTPFLELQERKLKDDLRSSPQYPGLNAEIPVAAQGASKKIQDAPFVKALEALPGLHSIYSGHDHGNTWCGNWLSSSPESNHRIDFDLETPIRNPYSHPFLCFAKLTGYGGYGPWGRGSRNIMMRFEKKDDEMEQIISDSRLITNTHIMRVETWVRLANSEVVQRVDLNETYGVDQYPTSTGETDME